MEEKPYNIEAIILRDTERDNLHISWDDEDGFVLFFTPDMQNASNHYHVELTGDQATRLSSFLNKKLSEIQGQQTR